MHCTAWIFCTTMLEFILFLKIAFEFKWPHWNNFKVYRESATTGGILHWSPPPSQFVNHSQWCPSPAKWKKNVIYKTYETVREWCMKMLQYILTYIPPIVILLICLKRERPPLKMSLTTLVITVATNITLQKMYLIVFRHDKKYNNKPQTNKKWKKTPLQMSCCIIFFRWAE